MPGYEEIYRGTRRYAGVRGDMPGYDGDMLGYEGICWGTRGLFLLPRIFILFFYPAYLSFSFTPHIYPFLLPRIYRVRRTLIQSRVFKIQLPQRTYFMLTDGTPLLTPPPLPYDVPLLSSTMCPSSPLRCAPPLLPYDVPLLFSPLPLPYDVPALLLSPTMCPSSSPLLLSPPPLPSSSPLRCALYPGY